MRRNGMSVQTLCLLSIYPSPEVVPVGVIYALRHRKGYESPMGWWWSGRLIKEKPDTAHRSIGPCGTDPLLKVRVF